ncbi:MAG: LysR family transcriptional regulator, glycine cleavage system transcriptional activator [Pseudomonadota bacterium]
MLRDLPALPGLLAFEAAARLGGFQQAAEALHLTPSAISHRIRQLETELGQPLFERQHRRVSLTPAGRRYYAVVHDALFRLAEASAGLRPTGHRCLRLSVAPALGSKWLIGRLSQYQEARPDVEFELATSTSLGPLLAGDADLGLRYGDEEWPGLDAWKLFDESLIPVCSPDYAARLPGLPDPAALADARLLRHPLLSWPEWFAACGLPASEARGPRFDDALLMLEAAAAGQGLALITATLATPYLASGQLVCPLPQQAPGRAFYAVAPAGVRHKPWIMDFFRWLVRNARQAAPTGDGTA